MICPTYSHRSFLPRNHRLYNADGHMLCSEKKNCTLEMIGKFKFEKFKSGTSLVVQWLRLHVPNTGGPGSTSGQGIRSHMLQLRPGAAE